MISRTNILLTHKCNLNCIHCYMSAGCSIEDTESIFVKAKNILDKLAEDGIYNVMFSGGECMLFPYLKDLIKYARQKEMYVTIFTNGMIYDEEIFDLVDSICLSLDGPENIHNYIRKNKKSYKNVLKVLDYLKKKDKYTTIQVTISSLNKECLDFIVNIGLNYLNIRTVKMVFVLNEGRALENNINYDEKEVSKILDYIKELYVKTKFHIQFIPNYINYYDFKQYYLSGDIKFPLWFDLVDDKFYLFNNISKYSNSLSEYSISLVNDFYKGLLEDLKCIESKYNDNELNLEEELVKLYGGQNVG